MRKNHDSRLGVPVVDQPDLNQRQWWAWTVRAYDFSDSTICFTGRAVYHYTCLNLGRNVALPLRLRLGIYYAFPLASIVKKAISSRWRSTNWFGSDVAKISLGNRLNLTKHLDGCWRLRLKKPLNSTFMVPTTSMMKFLPKSRLKKTTMLSNV